ncbi:hypothetical protein TWF694_005066 [Orbilia ellipsospora]|uniref:Uncharacterized protein n=1 Tax=Orbilia ellipsospora TaxID=2528407 RepID=A0AAV9WVK2_9PEZI
MKITGIVLGLLATTAIATPLNIPRDSNIEASVLEARMPPKSGGQPQTNQIFPGVDPSKPLREKDGVFFRSNTDQAYRDDMAQRVLGNANFKKAVLEAAEVNKKYAAEPAGSRKISKKYIINTAPMHENENGDKRKHATFMEWIVPEKGKPFSNRSWHLLDNGRVNDFQNSQISSGLPSYMKSTPGHWNEGMWVKNTP